MKNTASLYHGIPGALLFGIIMILSACSKQDQWLDVKRNNSDVTPKTLQDFQAILDNNQVMNGYSSVIGSVSSDNVYAPDAYLNAVDQVQRNAYLWNKDIYQGATANDWLYPYQVVEYANIVLDGLEHLEGNGSQQEMNNIRGSALFYRAFAFYELAQLYCKWYDPNTAATDKGIPIRLTSDVNVKVGRLTVEETYQRILGDLHSAADLLPKIPPFKTRPSAVSAKALLARIYLAMGRYNDAMTLADQAIKESPALLDFNTLTITSANPFPTFAKGNPEVLFHAWGLGNTLASVNGRGRVDPAIYTSYQTGDLRRTAFFVADGATGLFRFKGTYAANAYFFCGLATNEMYLTRAECLARSGDSQGALADLNKLLQNRLTKAAFVPIQITDNDQLLTRILLERRKELPFTGQCRWDDLRRLNRSPSTSLTLRRTYNGQNYSLPPNDSRYILPIPDDEIILNNLEPNIR